MGGVEWLASALWATPNGSPGGAPSGPRGPFAICVLVLFVGWSSRWEGWITELFCPKTTTWIWTLHDAYDFDSQTSSIEVFHEKIVLIGRLAIMVYALWLAGADGEKESERTLNGTHVDHVTGRSQLPSLPWVVCFLYFFLYRPLHDISPQILDAIFHCTLKLSCLDKPDHPVGGGGK